MEDHKNCLYYGDNLPLRGLPDGLADLVYIDPPFNTGKTQRHYGLHSGKKTDDTIVAERRLVAPLRGRK